ncbi:gliding motility lipoprotein GldB [Spongiimicrobium salis]|uniref:gliding motility lipoprotein GldB n=1 Tax=Spongiimicrobium salis TaxID=1667022 RepID=UPI00374DD808
MKLIINFYGNRKRWSLLLLIPLLLFLNCNEEDKIAEAIDKIDVRLEIARFDQEFANALASDIPALRKTYPYLFPAPDSVWIAKLKDSLQLELNAEVRGAFGDFSGNKAELVSFFKHVKYYFPKYSIPKVVTMTNDVDYNNRVILADSLLLVGLDNYLGKEHKFYVDIYDYIASRLDSQFLISDIASTFSRTVVPRPENRTFLAQLIYYGKELYIKDKLIPFNSDAQKIGYTPEELEWAKVNEEAMWRYFIEQQLLYSTDSSLGRRFLDPAPFSKFRLELDSESPGQVGRFLGWQIVRSFMENNAVDLQQMLSLPAEEIFKKSNYKPKK